MDISDFQILDQWWRSSDRIYNLLFVQFEESMSTYPYYPYFAALLDYKITGRKLEAIDVEFTITEGK